MRTEGDVIRSWLVCLVPRFVWRWVWSLDVPLGKWAPFVLGRVIGSNCKRVG